MHGMHRSAADRRDHMGCVVEDSVEHSRTKGSVGAQPSLVLVVDDTGMLHPLRRVLCCALNVLICQQEFLGSSVR